MVEVQVRARHTLDGPGATETLLNVLFHSFYI